MITTNTGPTTARKCTKCLQWYAYGTSTIGPCVDSSYPAHGAWRDPAHDWHDVPIEEARAGDQPAPRETGSPAGDGRIVKDLPPEAREAVRRALAHDKRNGSGDLNDLIVAVALAVWRAGIRHGRTLERHGKQPPSS